MLTSPFELTRARPGLSQKEDSKMLIAVPLREEKFSTHFGGAEAFALYSVDETSREVQHREVVAPPKHSPGVFPLWLRGQGASVVLASGMGSRASDLFSQNGIEVILGAGGDDPDMVVRDFLDGRLQSTGDLCHDHDFHNCGHHERQPGPSGESHRAETGAAGSADQGERRCKV